MNKNKVGLLVILSLVIILTLSAVNSASVATDTQNNANNITKSPTKIVSTEKAVDNVKSKNIVKTQKNVKKEDTSPTAGSYSELINQVNTAKSASEPVTITLNPGNYEATNTMTWGGATNKVLTIDGNGNTLNGKGSYKFITVQSGHTLILKNMIIENYKSSGQGGAINVQNGQINIENVTFKDNTASSSTVGGAINIQNMAGQTSTINNSKFINNTATSLSGGALNVNLATVIINNTEFINNSVKGSAANGGAINNNMGKITIENSLFEGNKNINYHGGAISGDGDLNINNVTFNNNTAKLNGGAITDGSGNIIINNSKFLDNSAKTGGAICAKRANIKSTNTIFENNKATTGSAIYAENNNVELIKTTFKNNDPVEETISSSNAKITFKDEVNNYNELIASVNNAKTAAQEMTIVLNPGNYEATNTMTWGGATNKVLTIDGNGNTLNGKGSYKFITVQNGHTLKLKNMIIENYKSSGQGGAINVQNGQINIENVTFKDNTASSSTVGGAINIQNMAGQTSTINNSKFINNTATSLSGGALTVNMATVIINNTEFINNSVTGSIANGGAINNNMGKITIENSLFDGNKNINYHGGAISGDGNLNINNVTFKNNTAKEYGGAIKHGSDNLNINNSKFLDNSAKTGGTIYTLSTTTITLSNFENNNATTGAAIYARNNKINLTKNNFINNNATNETLALPGTTATFDNNTYRTTSILYDEYTLTLISEKEKYFPGDDIELNVTQKLKNPGFYDAYVQNMILSGIFINGESKLLSEENPVIITIDEYPSATEGVLNISAKALTSGIESNNITINVNEPLIPSVNVTNTTVVISETTNITAMFYEDNQPVTEGVAIFKVNGKTLRDDDGNVIYVPIVEGKATLDNVKITSDWLKPDTTIQAISSGSDNFDPIFTEKVVVNVTKPAADIVLTAPTEAKVGTEISLTATITSNGEKVNSGRVAFKFNGKTLKDESGKALYFDVKNGLATTTYTIPAKTKAKTYTLTAVFTDTQYDRVESNSDIAIIK